MNYALVTLVTIVILFIYLKEMNKTEIDVRAVAFVGLCSALACILSMIQFLQYPQGGGVSLFSMLPIMLLSLIFGNGVGLTGGIIFGLLKLINGAYVIHPLQFILDYVLASMVLGFAGTFGNDTKGKVFMGCLFAGILSALMCTLSGVVFFSEYAPEGMNVWVYSILYNMSSVGVEGLLTAIVMTMVPLKRFAKAVNKNIA